MRLWVTAATRHPEAVTRTEEDKVQYLECASCYSFGAVFTRHWLLTASSDHCRDHGNSMRGPLAFYDISEFPFVYLPKLGSNMPKPRLPVVVSVPPFRRKQITNDNSIMSSMSLASTSHSAGSFPRSSPHHNGAKITIEAHQRRQVKHADPRPKTLHHGEGET